jgi:glycosidase
MKLRIYLAAAVGIFLAGGGSLFPAQAPAESAQSAVPQYGTPFQGVPAPEDAVIYQVNLHAFSAEGNFAGVQARLDSIKALGVNTLYLLPIYPVGVLKTVNSPYCVRDYKEVNSEFGTLDELRTLVDEAHKRKMAVLFDWVANHTAWDNPWIAHKSWYKQDADGNIISPPNTGWKDVAALDYNNMEMRQAMIDAMRYWIYQTNIDGYRCDAADFIPFDFWQQAITSLRSIDTHKLLLFAEGKRKDQFTAGFDLEYGMSFYNNMVNRIYGTHQSAQSLDILNTTEYRDATGDDQVVRYISNHDVDQSDGSPLATLNGRQGSLAAFVVAAYMKGVPMIYDGQEVGCPLKLSFFDQSTPIDWSINPDLTGEYKRIIGLRTASNALRRGELHSFTTDDVCAFSKSWEAEEILVLVNLRSTPSSCPMPEPLLGKSWKDAFTGTDVTLPRQVDLQPYQYLVYKKR